uniref:Uncharacterized protein n=1 Tax=Pseudomonas aeruginosa TaxID=287 RepID=Q9APT7_PSEAI|nr:hypothetical protein [Pseudomonas aeruginosa]
MAIILMRLVGIVHLISKCVLHEVPSLFIETANNDGAICDHRLTHNAQLLTKAVEKRLIRLLPDGLTR